MLLILAIGVMALLYFCNPAECNFFPRCPFFVLTGFKCPGCGTLRAFHLFLHGQIAEAIAMNPIHLVAIPFLAVICCSKRIAHLKYTGYCAFAVTMLYWILRNVFGF